MGMRVERKRTGYTLTNMPEVIDRYRTRKAPMEGTRGN